MFTVDVIQQAMERIGNAALNRPEKPPCREIRASRYMDTDKFSDMGDVIVMGYAIFDTFMSKVETRQLRGTMIQGGIRIFDDRTIPAQTLEEPCS